MKRWLIAMVLLGMFAQWSWAASITDDREQAAAARKILDAWRESNAQPAERYLHIVCWTPADRELPAEYRDRLSRILLHIQKFYGDELERNGFGPRSFNLPLDEEGRIVMHEVRGSHPARHYEVQSGSEIRRECLPVLRQAGLNADQETIAIFCNLATWDEVELRFSHKSPYYAGGSYRSGTAWQLDSPELDTLNLPKKSPIIRDGQYGQISLGKHNSIFIGGTAHELGHAFGLPHVKARPDQSVHGTALMGSGNRTYGDEIRGEGKGSFLTFAHALRLASHPLFCGYLETERGSAKASLTDLEIRADGKAIAVSGKITGEPPVYGVIAYFDPEGNSDYDQASTTAIPAADGRFELRCDALVPGKGVLKLVPLHANGAASGSQRLAYPYRVADDGTPQLQTIETKQALQPIVEALGQGDTALARRLADELQTKGAEQLATVAAALADTSEPTETPAEYQGDLPAANLTKFKAEAVSVGWARPAFNRIPEASMLLEAAGEVFATGIYAHAPARHEYSLGGRWETLQGQVGIAAGNGGTVRFEIHGDGRLLWQSPTVRADRLIPFKVSLQGVKKLELVTSPTADGPSGDWGLWLEPQLLRAQ